MEIETVTQNAVAAALADYDIIVTSLGLLRVTANVDRQVALRPLDQSQKLVLWLERNKDGWRVVDHGGANDSDPKLTPDQRTEIIGIVRGWARTHVQHFIDADREYFFDLIETVAETLSGNENEDTHIPATEEDTELCGALNEFGGSFLRPKTLDSVRRAVESLTSAQRMVKEAEALFRQAAAERKAA